MGQREPTPPFEPQLPSLAGLFFADAELPTEEQTQRQLEAARDAENQAHLRRVKMRLIVRSLAFMPPATAALVLMQDEDIRNAARAMGVRMPMGYGAPRYFRHGKTRGMKARWTANKAIRELLQTKFVLGVAGRTSLGAIRDRLRMYLPANPPTDDQIQRQLAALGVRPDPSDPWWYEGILPKRD